MLDSKFKNNNFMSFSGNLRSMKLKTFLPLNTNHDGVEGDTKTRACPSIFWGWNLCHANIDSYV